MQLVDAVEQVAPPGVAVTAYISGVGPVAGAVQLTVALWSPCAAEGAVGAPAGWNRARRGHRAREAVVDGVAGDHHDTGELGRERREDVLKRVGTEHDVVADLAVGAEESHDVRRDRGATGLGGREPRDHLLARPPAATPHAAPTAR